MELTVEEQMRLTQAFAAHRERVWQQPYIKHRLLEMSHGKCCYCECKIEVESKYTEIEHFYHKDGYPEQVVSWGNLLPACRRCNAKKGAHDVGAVPIINPCEADPRNHLTLRNYVVRGKDELGKNTIAVLDLNEIDRLVVARWHIGTRVELMVVEILEATTALAQSQDQGTPRAKRELSNRLKALLRQANRRSPYSAFTAAALLGAPEWCTVKEMLKDLDLWDLESECLEEEAKGVALPAL